LQATKNKREGSENNIKKGIGIQLKCDFWRGLISGFCCTECRSAYKKRYSGRIEALIEGHVI